MKEINWFKQEDNFVKQEPGLCWAACAEMMLRFHHILEYGHGDIISFSPPVTETTGLKKLLIEFSGNSEIDVYSVSYKNKIEFAINQNSPVIANLDTGEIDNHMVIITGYDEDNYYYCDPARELTEQYVKVKKSELDIYNLLFWIKINEE